jgi:hypothetical protein
MTRVAVEFEWRAAGEIQFDGKPVFPSVPVAPGLYRFTFEASGAARRVYIGETDDLRRRVQLYRTPGASQRTNVRMNHELVAAMRAGVLVSCAVITTASLSLDGGESRPLDLSRKTGRLIVENAAMAGVIAEREADPINGPILVNRPGVGEEEWR